MGKVVSFSGEKMGVFDQVKNMTVALSDIHMDTYQRKVDPVKVSKIVEEFNIHKVGSIDLSFRDGKFYCIDGQNRVEACKQVGIQEISANVHYGLTKQGEAFLFAFQHENQRSISQRDKWNALCEARWPLAVMVTDVCREFDFTMCGNTKDGRSINAVREMLKIAQNHGKPGLRYVLGTLRGAFNHNEQVAHWAILAGLNRVITTFPSVMAKGTDRVVRSLCYTTPHEIFNIAARLGGSRGERPTAMAILKHINKGVRKTSPNWLNPNLIL